MKKKLMDWAYDHCPSLHFLLRSDVSVRFKIANLITGDRLRPALAFTHLTTKKMKTVCEHYPETTGFLEWYIDRALSAIDDIWNL